MEHLSNLVMKAYVHGKNNGYNGYTKVSKGAWNFEVQITGDEKNSPMELTTKVLVKGNLTKKPNNQTYSWDLPTTINTDDVQSTSWHGAVLYTAK